MNKPTSWYSLDLNLRIILEKLILAEIKYFSIFFCSRLRLYSPSSYWNLLIFSALRKIKRTYIWKPVGCGSCPFLDDGLHLFYAFYWFWPMMLLLVSNLQGCLLLSQIEIISWMRQKDSRGLKWNSLVNFLGEMINEDLIVFYISLHRLNGSFV